MTDDDVIYGEMFDEIDLFAETNSLELAPHTDIMKYLGETKALNILYKIAGAKQTQVITGSTKDKTISRSALESLILNVSRPLAGHFYDNSNMELSDQLKCDSSLLKGLRAGELISRAENLKIICTDHPLDLTACNILPAKITELTVALTTFTSLSILPHDKIKGRANTGKELRIIRNKILSIIKNKLTNSMYTFENVNNLLLDSYLNIIKLVHTGVRHIEARVPSTFKSFQLYSATTNEKINRGIMQVFETPTTIVSRIDGSFRNVKIQLGYSTIQAMAFGYMNYSEKHDITNENTDVIAINMTPLV